ncbi:MAG: hypothetical protein AABY07_04270 [Nanoarchaeota archaeon]
MKTTIIILFVLIFMTSMVNAAILHGEIFDFSLEPLSDAVVEINTEPKQVKVAKDGKYEFELEPGNYIIKTAYSNDIDLYYEQNITIKDKDGRYNVDLILLPVLEEEDFEDIENIFEEKQEASPALLVILIITSAFSILYLFRWFTSKKVTKKEEKEETEGDLDELISFIKKEGGRVTQKDIRKRFPLSEAKISLMISELEHKGVLEKIKKGRGNIIILKKD